MRDRISQVAHKFLYTTHCTPTLCSLHTLSSLTTDTQRYNPRGCSPSLGQLVMAVLRGRVLLLVGLAAAMQPVARSTRRSFVLQGAACAACSIGLSRPASATLNIDLREAEAGLMASTGGKSTEAALDRILAISLDYGGMPSDELRKEVVELMRKKRDALKAVSKEAWSGVEEEEYQRVMRIVDPWRVVEILPLAQYSFLAFAPVYLGLLAVQQFLPKLFVPAYAGGVAVVFAPVLLQLLFG